MKNISIGDTVEVDNVPINGANPFTVSGIGQQSEGAYFGGTWANGVAGIVFPEDLA